MKYQDVILYRRLSSTAGCNLLMLGSLATGSGFVAVPNQGIQKICILLFQVLLF